MATEAPPAKKELSEKQQAHMERLRQLNTQRGADKGMAPAAAPPSNRQSWLARHGRRAPEFTREDAEEVGAKGNPAPGRRPHSGAGGITVEHEMDPKVKMWKLGPGGWRPRPVPSHNIENNLANGWMEYCPDCGGTECESDPNTCPAKYGVPYIVCPVSDANGRPCAHRINATGTMPSSKPEEDAEEPDPLQLTDVYELNPRIELKAKMDLHIMTFHRDEARALGLFGTVAPPPRMGMEIQWEPQSPPE